MITEVGENLYTCILYLLNQPMLNTDRLDRTQGYPVYSLRGFSAATGDVFL